MWSHVVRPHLKNPDWGHSDLWRRHGKWHLFHCRWNLLDVSRHLLKQEVTGVLSCTFSPLSTISCGHCMRQFIPCFDLWSGTWTAPSKEDWDLHNWNTGSTPFSSPGSSTPMTHMTDIVILGVLFLLREIEIANCLFHHLVLEGNELHLIPPVHKTSTGVSWRVRSLFEGQRGYDAGGSWNAGEPHTAPRALEFNSGGTLRAAAPLAAVPSIPGNILNGFEDGATAIPHSVQVPNPGTPAALATRQSRQEGSTSRETRQQISGLVTKLAALESEVKALSDLIARPAETLIVRHRSNIVHQSAVDEQQNEPTTWHTRCGLYYGCKRFFRVLAISDKQRRCQKCFQLEHSGVESPDGGSDADDSGSSSSSSTDSELEVPVD